MIKHFILTRLGYSYDAGKKTYYRFTSDCHKSPVIQKALLNGKELTKPFNQVDESKVIYRYFCSLCGEMCGVRQDIK